MVTLNFSRWQLCSSGENTVIHSGTAAANSIESHALLVTGPPGICEANVPAIELCVCSPLHYRLLLLLCRFLTYRSPGLTTTTPVHFSIRKYAGVVNGRRDWQEMMESAAMMMKLTTEVRTTICCTYSVQVCRLYGMWIHGFGHTNFNVSKKGFNGHTHTHTHAGKKKFVNRNFLCEMSLYVSSSLLLFLIWRFTHAFVHTKFYYFHIRIECCYEIAMMFAIILYIFHFVCERSERERKLY